MLIKKLTEEEQELAQYIHDPVLLSSALFTAKVENLESLKSFDEDSFFQPRLYQLPMYSYEYLIAENDELSDLENFELKKKAGTRYLYCGRKLGKSLLQLIDLLFDTIHNLIDWVTTFSSFDDVHVAGITEPYVTIMQEHPFLRLFKLKVQRKFNRYTVEGHTLETVNMNLSSKRSGSSWEKIHSNKIVIDEHQYETDDVAHKRSQSTSEKGCIERLSGITSFKKHSPAGRIFSDLTKKNFLVNYPQLVSPFWNKQAKEQAIKDYQGEETLGYKTNILAEVCEDAIGLYDMERIRQYYDTNRRVKHFEISKDELNRFADILIIDRPLGVETLWINIDFGETAPSELVIIFGVGDFYKYEYNITLYKLTPDEQTEIIKYIAEKLQANYIAIDCSEEGGRQIFRDLSKYFSPDNLVWCGFQEKIEVDVKKDEEGRTIIKDGNVIWEREFVSDWSVRRLKTLLYFGKLIVPFDHKFDKQFSSMISAKSNARIIFGSSEKEDHLHSAFQVFGIAEWIKKQIINKPITKKTWGTGFFGKI